MNKYNKIRTEQINTFTLFILIFSIVATGITTVNFQYKTVVDCANGQCSVKKCSLANTQTQNITLPPNGLWVQKHIVRRISRGATYHTLEPFGITYFSETIAKTDSIKHNRKDAHFVKHNYLILLFLIVVFFMFVFTTLKEIFIEPTIRF